MSWRKAIYKGLHTNCIVFGKESDNISDILGLCVGCIREDTNINKASERMLYSRIKTSRECSRWKSKHAREKKHERFKKIDLNKIESTV